MIVVGLEGTAHSAGVGVVDTSKRGEEMVLVNDIDTYTPEKGGIHPREAANHHALVFPDLIKRAINNIRAIGLGPRDIDLVGFSMGPGLGPCLRSTAVAARSLALKLNRPIIGVNHCIAHLEIGQALFDECQDPILLYVSGGNTQVIAYVNGRYRVFGETLDIGIGNMLDKFARLSGIPFPGGPEIERLALKGRKFAPLPYSVKGMDVAFSGILTAARNLLKAGKVSLEDLCFSIQETAFAMLVEVTERAMAHTEKKNVLLGGGVARNSRLQEMVFTMARERGARAFVPPPKLCVDNGAMIAYLASVMWEGGVRMDIKDTAVRQNYRTDEVDVTWR